MRFLNDTLLLQVWEAGQYVSAIRRPLIILGAVLPEFEQEKITRLALGQRDAFLIQARRLRFGSGFNARGDCPNCGEKLELALDSDQLLSMQSLSEVPNGHLNINDHEISFRTLNTLDLLTAAECANVEMARRVLFENCIISASKGNEALAITELSDEWIPVVANEASQCDPLAEISVGMECPACGHIWQAHLDIASYFWIEICAEAARLFRNIHTLAAAYHWSENDILAMSPLRRESYLRLVHHE